MLSVFPCILPQLIPVGQSQALLCSGDYQGAIAPTWALRAIAGEAADVAEACMHWSCRHCLGSCGYGLFDL